MRTKKILPIKWMVGIIIVLTLVAHRTYQASHNAGLSTSSGVSSSHENFFQFLADLLGFGSPGNSSSESSGKNNALNQKGPGTRQLQGSSIGGNQQYLNTSTAEGISASQETNNGQEKNTAENNAVINEGGNPESAGEDNGKNNPDINSGDNPDTNSETNSESNSEINAVDNSQVNGSNNTGNNSGSNTNNNSGDNSEINNGNNSGGNSGDNSGGSVGTSSSGNSGNNPGSNSGNNFGGFNPSNLPTINPIPSDSSVSQSVAQQNQQGEALSSLISQRQALVVPVQQQAQASKYQTVNSQTLPAPSPNLPPPDVQAKAQTHQITFH